MFYLPHLRVAESLLSSSRIRYGLFLRGHQRCSYSTAAENKAKDVTPTSPPIDGHTGPPSLASLTHHRVDKLEKYFLVWGGKFKSLAEVPTYVSQDTMERARNKARIKISLMMAAATAFGCMLMVMSGKKAQQRGESVVKINEEWHKQIKAADQKLAETSAENVK